MNIFVKITLFAFLLIGCVLLFLPISFFPDFYDVRYMGFAALTNALLIYGLPELLRVAPSTPNATIKNEGVSLFQNLLTMILFLNALGDLGLYQLYKVGFEFDKLVHLLIPLASTLILPQFFQKRFGMKRSKSIFLAIFLSLFFVAFWEVFEYLSDTFFETHIYGVYGTDIRRDTFFDIIYGIVGSVFALLLHMFWPQMKKM